MLRQWRKRNPELVRAQKQRYYERKVWPRVPRTRQGKRKDCKEYDPDEILRDLFGVRVVLTDFKKSVAPPPPPSLPPPPPPSPPPPPPSSRRRQRKKLAYSSSSSDSETDEGLSKELDQMLAEPEEPVGKRIEQIRKNRKKAEANRVKRMLKRQKQEEMITAISTELDGMSSMLYDMDKWFTQFEREDTVAQATQFAYTHSVEISTGLVNELEHFLF